MPIGRFSENQLVTFLNSNWSLGFFFISARHLAFFSFQLVTWLFFIKVVMNIISREEAVCLFYAVPFNQENVNKYISIISQIEDVDKCFTRNPHKPRLLCTRVIYANAFDIHLYKSQTDLQ